MAALKNIFSDGNYDYDVSIADYLFILLIILMSSETVMFGTNAISQYITFRQAVSLLLIPIIIIKSKYTYDEGNPNSLFTCGWILAALIILSGLVNGELGLQCFMRALIIIAGFYYVRATSLKTFMIAFEKVVFIIVVTSLLLKIIALLAPTLLNISLPLENVGGIRYRNYILACITDDGFGKVAYRLQGPFREPGVAIIYFIYAFVFYLINTTKVNLFRIAAYISAILLSYSTTGYFALFAAILFYFIKVRGSKTRKADIIILALVAISVVALYVYTDIFAADSIAFGKLNDENNLSTLSRLASFYNNVEIIKQHPVFGAGIEKTQSLFLSLSASSYGADVVDNANLYMTYAATYGILYGILCVLGCFYFSYNLVSGKVAKIALCLPLMLVFMGETMFENVFVFILIAYGFNRKKLVFDEIS